MFHECIIFRTALTRRAGETLLSATIFLFACAIDARSEDNILSLPSYAKIYDLVDRDGGWYPSNSDLAVDANGALYGTTQAAGANNAGTAYRLTPPRGYRSQWTRDVLYAFRGGSDAANPKGGVVSDRYGAFYGTSWEGGGSSNCPAGCGTVFKLTPPSKAGESWSEKVLYSFKGADGANPAGALAFDTRGALYGTTFNGGSANLGSVFKLTPPRRAGDPWKFTQLHSFTGGADGYHSYAKLAFDDDGSLYGTAVLGGNCGNGLVFKLTPAPFGGETWTKSAVHHFCGADGGFPGSGVVFGPNGALFGTTQSGGGVYRLSRRRSDPDGLWDLTVLYALTTAASGYGPFGGVTFAFNGSLYGATTQGGSFGQGVAFKLTPPNRPNDAWTQTVLHNFSGGTDGSSPQAGLTLGYGGLLYGTTYQGGGANAGVVYQLPLR